MTVNELIEDLEFYRDADPDAGNSPVIIQGDGSYHQILESDPAWTYTEDEKEESAFLIVGATASFFEE